MANHPSNERRPLESRNPSEDARRYAWLAEVGMHNTQFLGRLIASDLPLDVLVGQEMAEDDAHGERDENRYAWLRDGGFFHRVCGVIAASGATGDQFDALVDEAMTQDESED